MKRIGLLSDTHTFIHPKVYEYFKDCNEIWHAGDIGDLETANTLMDFKSLKAVYGNIDGYPVRAIHPKVHSFDCEKVKVLMTHIGGYPGWYEKDIQLLIKTEEPQLFISGHSHILKVIFDEKNNLLHINPGAAGKFGLHLVSTLVRFVINEDNITDLEILEIPRQVQ